MTTFLFKEIKEPVKLIQKQHGAKENSSLTTGGDWFLPCSIIFNFLDHSCIILDIIIGYTTSPSLPWEDRALVGHPGFHWEVNITSRSRDFHELKRPWANSIYLNIQTPWKELAIKVPHLNWSLWASPVSSTVHKHGTEKLSNAYLEKEVLGYSERSPCKGQVNLLTSCIRYKRNKGIYACDFG